MARQKRQSDQVGARDAADERVVLSRKNTRARGSKMGRGGGALKEGQISKLRFQIGRWSPARGVVLFLRISFA
jgi:hypothetical protein